MALKPTQSVHENSGGTNRAAKRHQRRWASLAETAHYLGFENSRTVREAIAAGKFPGYKLNARVIRCDLNEVDAAMQPFGGDV